MSMETEPRGTGWTPELLQQLRGDLGNWTQEHAAQAVNMSIQTWDRWERGVQRIASWAPDLLRRSIEYGDWRWHVLPVVLADGIPAAVRYRTDGEREWLQVGNVCPPVRPFRHKVELAQRREVPQRRFIPGVEIVVPRGTIAELIRGDD